MFINISCFGLGSSFKPSVWGLFQRFALGDTLIVQFVQLFNILSFMLFIDQINSYVNFEGQWAPKLFLESFLSNVLIVRDVFCLDGGNMGRDKSAESCGV